MPSVLPDTGIANSAILTPPPMPRTDAARTAAAKSGDAPFAAMLDSPEPATPAPRESRTASRDRSAPTKPTAARAPQRSERPDAEPTGPRNRSDTVSGDARSRGATSEATAKTPNNDRETKPETLADDTAKPANEIAADAAPVAPADVPAEPTPATTPAVAAVDGEADAADASQKPVAAAPGATPLPAAEPAAENAKPATDPKAQISAAPVSTGAATPDADADAAAKPAIAAAEKPGLIPIEIKGEAEETAKPQPEADAEAVKQARPAEEIKAPQPERTARPFEPFAAVRAAAEAMQSLNGATGVQPVPASGIPAIHAAAASAAPTATAAASQPQPVPMAGVAIEIATQALAGKNRFEIRLDPPELGRIDVRLDVDKDGNVTSKLIVERAETLDLLRRDAQQLERALQQAGLKTSDSALQFSLRDQGAERDGDQPSQRGGRDSESDETTPAIDARRHRATLRAGGLDISI